MQDNQQHESLVQTVKAVWSRRKWWAIAVFTLGFAAVVSLTTSLPKVYEASATILINREAAPALPEDMNEGQSNLLDSITAQVMSRSRLQSLIKRFDLYREARDNASTVPISVIEQMRDAIQLERMMTDQQQWGKNPVFAFTLTYQGWDPELVAKVTNALAASYVNENNRIRASQLDTTVTSLENQIASIKSKLDSQEQQINDFRNAHMGELPGQMQVNLSAITRLNLQLNQVRQNLIASKRRQDELLQQMAETGDNSLVLLQQELANLRAKYTENYPGVVRVKAQIAALRERRQNGTAVSPLQRQYASLERQINAYQQQEQKLQSEIVMYEQRVQNVPVIEEQLQTLKQGYAEIQAVYSSLLTRYQKAKLAAAGVEGSAAAQYRILETAVTPTSPAGPDRRRLLMVGLILCLGAAAGVVFLLEQMDTSFHTTAGLQAFTTVPVLVGIPEIVTTGDAWRNKVHFGLMTVLLVAALVVVVLGFGYIGRGNEQLVWLLTGH